MNFRRHLVWSVAAFALAGCSEPGESLSVDLIIEGASIVDAREGTISRPQDILIRDGLIIHIAAAGGKSAGVKATQRIDANGLYLVPGLIDVHAHIGHGGLADHSREDREEALEQFVRYGVTTVFVPGGGGGNDEQLLQWKTRCGSREIICPDVFGSGDIITAYGSHPITTIWDLPADTDPDIIHARGAVSLKEDEPVAPLISRKADLPADAIKIVVDDGPGAFAPKPRLSKSKIAEIVEAAHARNLKVYAHISLAAHADDVIAAGADGIMHSADDPISDETLLKMAKHGAFYVATLSLFDGFASQADGRREQEPFAVAGISRKALASLDNEAYWFDGIDSPEEVATYMEAITATIRRAEELGVPIALGTDTNNPQVFPGYAAHEELALMVAAGLTPQAALIAATAGGASFLGLENEVGQIKPGFQADLLVLQANPLEDITNSRQIRYVVSNGFLVDNIVSEVQ